MEEGVVRSERVAERTGVMGWFDNSRNFLAEVRNEMKRVTWPSKKEVYATTFVVILTAAFFGIYLWGLDLAINWFVNFIYGRFGA